MSVSLRPHGILQARVLEWVAFPSPEDRPNPGIEPRSPTLQADSLPTEPPGKPKNTGVGSLFFSRAYLSDPGIELGSLALQADSLRAELPGNSLTYEVQFNSSIMFSVSF